MICMRVELIGCKGTLLLLNDTSYAILLNLGKWNSSVRSVGLRESILLICIKLML